MVISAIQLANFNTEEAIQMLFDEGSQNEILAHMTT